MRPGPRLLPLLTLWCAGALASAILPALPPWWRGATLLLVLIAVIDLARLLRQPPVEAAREVPGSLALGVWRGVTLTLTNPGAARRVEVFDEYPAQAEFARLPRSVRLPARATLTLEYDIRPAQRGAARFGHLQVLSHSPLGLWTRKQRAGVPQEVRVYPNFAAVVHYALLATGNHLSQLGVRRKRRRGAGLEFHQLRDYRAGDALRQIDWKATARMQRLISRDYQDERDQQVVFLLDCGRRMRAREPIQSIRSIHSSHTPPLPPGEGRGEGARVAGNSAGEGWGEFHTLSHFDNALDAMLLLAYVALRQGDGVGLLTFSGTERHLAPVKGAASVNVLLNRVFDLEPGTHTPDYLDAARRVMERFRKRSLIVLISNLRDEDNTELLPALKLLSQRHRVMVASLQEEIIQRAARDPVRDFDDALRYGAVHHYLQQRRRAHDSLRGAGAWLLDVKPRDLAVEMVNRYFEIKRAGVL